jgi:Ca-activated chloride channel family protein
MIAIMMLAASVCTAAQTHSAEDTPMMFVNVTALTRGDRVAANLKPEDFTLLENGSPQPVRYFSHGDEPVSLVVVYDATSSMPARIREGQAVLAELIRTSHPEDDLGLILTQDKAQVAVALGGSRSDIEKEAGTIHAGGFRALWDGMFLGISQLQHARYQRKAMVVISDGGDETSRHTPAELRKLLQQAGVEVYGIGTFNPYAGRLTARTNSLRLDELLTTTGGRAISAYNEDNFAWAAARISHELHTQYVLGYYPAHENRDSKDCKLEVRPSASASSAKLHLHYGTGYCPAAS